VLLFCLIVSLLLVAWGIWKGPLCSIEDYIDKDGYPYFGHNPSQFFGAAAAVAFGLFGVLLSVLFWTGVLTVGR
jgi:hypothetical protein